MTILPFFVEKCAAFFALAKSFLQSNVNRYKVGVVLDIFCIVLLLAHGPYKTPNFSLISPLSSLPIAYTSGTHEVFSFIPGWTTTKLQRVDYANVHTLAYFDIPLNTNGTLNQEVDGYWQFQSDGAIQLFQSARSQGVNVVLTVSLADNDSIKTLLNDTQAQQTAINETITAIQNAGINGANITFEFKGDEGSIYRNKFTAFVEQFAREVHQRIANGHVSVSVNSESAKEAFYDMQTLSKSVDRIFLMAYTFPVPELQNSTHSAPVYGYGKDAYWKIVSDAINTLLPYVPANKLVLETAWYGNGQKYPDVAPADKNSTLASQNTLQTPLPSETIEGLLLEVPQHSRAAAQKNLPLIAKALEDEGVLTANVLAYALATIEHETAETFEPIDEFKGRRSARRLGYEGGTNYFGRGFIQLTHLRNYKRMGERIGMGDTLAKNPELASEPTTAAKVLAAFFKDNGIAELAIAGNFTAARRPINPDRQGYSIAMLAWKYLWMIG